MFIIPDAAGRLPIVFYQDVPLISPVLPVYNRFDVAFTHGEGAWLFDAAGRRYLDFSSGVAVSCLGHCHPHLVEALTAQARMLWHTSNLYRVEGQETLSRRLIEASFADTVFFTNSGVEAWECGVKTVRRHFFARGMPEKTRIITIDGAFHGRSLAAISATRSEKMIGGFGPLLDGFDVVPFGDLAAMRAAITPHTAAILVEPIIGEGGVRVWSGDQLREIRRIADEAGLLLYFDEIQCGMGRTGRLFACDWSGVAPDVMCVAKGIGGGFPLGACLATAHAAGGMTAGYHGSTYGGNPLAMAVGNAVLDILLQPDFLRHVVETGEVLRDRLMQWTAGHPALVQEIRGTGLMLGLRLAQGRDPRAFVQTALSHGLLLVPAADNVVRVLPPLIIGAAEIDQAITLLDEACAGMEAAA